jgi:non-ribosomal peptide synthetase component F
MTLLAAFDVVLRGFGEGRQSGGAPTPAATPRSRLVGFFVNTLVLRTDLAGDPTFRALLARVRETCISAFAHGEVPFEKIVEELEPARDLARTPLFQVMLDLQNLPAVPAVLRGLRLEPLDVEGRGAKFDLTLTLHETEDGLSGAAEYATDLFDETTVARWLAALRRVLEAVSLDAGQRISRLPVVGKAERDTLLREWNEAPLPRPRGSRHALVEEAA